MLSLIACSVWVAMGGLVGLLGPAIPAIAKQLGVEDTELGWAFSVRAGGYIIGSLVTSRLPERWVCMPASQWGRVVAVCTCIYRYACQPT